MKQNKEVKQIVSRGTILAYSEMPAKAGICRFRLSLTQGFFIGDVPRETSNAENDDTGVFIGDAGDGFRGIRTLQGL